MKETWIPLEQNGIKEYRPGTIGSRIWEIAERISGQVYIQPAIIIEECGKVGICAGSAKMGYYYYRKFHGIERLR